jgi:CRISPR-associated endonuclease/helicase Cas3
MRFALERASAQPESYRRIIVVIPFLSIIEQNAEVYRRVFGGQAIVEHHSGATYKLQAARNINGSSYFKPEEEEIASESDAALALRRPETENWDAPLIVTTSVRFFESLFSSHPSDLRRVHNIARSIVILDEVQTLPRRLLAPLLSMLRDLTDRWGCTIIMTTATQPAFEQRQPNTHASLWPPGTVREIMDNPNALHQALRRVRLEWRLESPIPWSDLARELLGHPQVLCVVNVLDHAAVLYALVQSNAQTPDESDSLFHLSTRMCAEHRLDVLARVRKRLGAGLACRVVSTQLIEAGVDVDFPIAYRALGPLDAIIQVAGRVDREGKATAAAGRAAGILVVFRTEDGKTPPNDYAEATGITAALASSSEIQLGDLEVMNRYFERFYGEADEKSLGVELAAMRGDRELKFRTLAEEFEMINSRMRDVFVSYGAGAGLISELMQSHHLDSRLLRRLQRFTVGLQPWEFDAARQAGLIVEVSPESGVWICSSAAYDEERGFLTRQDERKLIV